MYAVAGWNQKHRHGWMVVGRSQGQAGNGMGIRDFVSGGVVWVFMDKCLGDCIRRERG